jgi:flagellin-like hook-associated protein FlgL
MRELSTRAAAENITSAERSEIQKEINQHISTIDQIAASAEAEAATIIKTFTNTLH